MLLTEQAHMGQQPTKLENIQTQVVSFTGLCQILLLI